MKISTLDTPVTAPPAPSAAPETTQHKPPLSETLIKVISSEIQPHFPQSLLPEERASLADALVKAISDEVHTQLSTPMFMWGHKDKQGADKNSERAQGAGWTLGGAFAQAAGKKIGSAGGIGAKVFGAGVGIAGKVAEEYGKDTFNSAGGNDNSSKGPNAFSGFYKGLPTK